MLLITCPRLRHKSLRNILLHDWNLVVFVHNSQGGRKCWLWRPILWGECSCSVWLLLTPCSFIAALCLWPWTNASLILALGPAACWACYRPLVDWLHKDTLVSSKPESCCTFLSLCPVFCPQLDTELWSHLQNFRAGVHFVKVCLLQLLPTHHTDLLVMLTTKQNQNPGPVSAFLHILERRDKNVGSNPGFNFCFKTFLAKVPHSALHLWPTWSWASSFTT